MLVKGLITKLNLGDNKCTVRLPTFEVAGGAPIYVEAVFAISPGTYNGYSVKDVVIVGFEHEILNKPIVLGKLYIGPASENADRGDVSCNSLSVSNVATIPGTTKLLFSDDLLQNYSKYKSITDIIDTLNAVVKTSTTTNIQDWNMFYKNGNIGIGTQNPIAKLDVVGDIRHTGLIMTTGTNVDQLKSITFTSALTTAWTDVTGVSGTYLATGSYIVQIKSNDEYYTGHMSWFSGSTTSTVADEIELHRAGSAASSARIYSRVIRTLSGTLKLQVSASTYFASHTMVFKFRRII